MSPAAATALKQTTQAAMASRSVDRRPMIIGGFVLETWSTNNGRMVRWRTRGARWPMAYDAPGGGIRRYARPTVPLAR
eukprot:5744120-Prymnesium_polylepis.1